MEKEMSDNPNSFLRLDGLEMADKTLQIGSITVAGSFDVDPDKTLSLNLALAHDNPPDFSSLDYNDPSSAIKKLMADTTLDDTLDDHVFKNYLTKERSQPITVPADVDLTFTGAVSASDVEVTSMKINVLKYGAEKSVSSAELLNFNQNSLKVNKAEQTISGRVTFEGTVTADEVVVNEDTSSTDGVPLSPADMLPLDQANTINHNIKFTNVHLAKPSEFRDAATLNGIKLDRIILDTEDEAQVLVGGKKVFTTGLTLNDAVTLVTINGETKDKILNFKGIYAHDPDDENNVDYVQNIQTDNLRFNTIKVKKELKVTKMGEDDSDQFDVTDSILSNIVTTHKDDQVITSVTTFTKDVTMSNLVSSAVGSADSKLINPSKVFIKNVDQTFTESFELLDPLVVTGDLEVANLNGLNLDVDVARTDEDNVFNTAVIFDDIVVQKRVDVADGKKIANVDVSELEVPVQQYNGEVTVTGSLEIDQNDFPITNIELSSTTIPASAEDIKNRWIYKDTDQELPNLSNIQSSSFIFDTLSLRKTLDNLDLTEDVMHVTDGAETSSATVK